jgi:hypothetical protein
MHAGLTAILTFQLKASSTIFVLMYSLVEGNCHVFESPSLITISIRGQSYTIAWTCAQSSLPHTVWTGTLQMTEAIIACE